MLPGPGATQLGIFIGHTKAGLGRELINSPCKPDARVCFAPESDKSLHASEMSRRANTGSRKSSGVTCVSLHASHAEPYGRLSRIRLALCISVTTPSASLTPNARELGRLPQPAQARWRATLESSSSAASAGRAVSRPASPRSRRPGLDKRRDSP